MNGEESSPASEDPYFKRIHPDLVLRTVFDVVMDKTEKCRDSQHTEIRKPGAEPITGNSEIESKVFSVLDQRDVSQKLG